MCHNLGGSSETDHGNYYQWGTNSTTWVSGYTAPDNAWSDSQKTASDPCPSGWRVPTYAVWTKVRTVPSVWDDTKKGRNLDGTLFLPAAGYKDTAGATLVGIVGYYWGSTPNGTGSWDLYFNSSGIDMGYSNHHLGYSVRCVAE